MTRTRGMALLWVLMLIGLSLGLVAASLAVSRMAVTTSVATLERADGLFYAEAAAELAVSHIRQNADMHGNLRPEAALSLSGLLLATDVSMRYEADLSAFNSVGDHARSVVVKVWPSDVGGEALRPFVARATLRRDLTVSEWYVLDHELSVWRAGQNELPRFASCAAAMPRVTSVGGSRVSNTLQWSLESSSALPEQVRISWIDFRSGPQQTLAPTLTALQAQVTTPVVASESARPVRVVYLLEAVFDGRVVDACTVEVVTGRVFFESSPAQLCAPGDTVQVVWDANASAGVQLRLRDGGVTTLVSGESVGSRSVPVTREPGKARLELVLPSGLGGTQTIRLRDGGC